MSESQALWTLSRRRALRLQLASGPRELRLVEGQLWLTHAGSAQQQAEDIWLQPGQSLALAEGSDVVIEAWQDARFQLLVPPIACPVLARQLMSGLARKAWPAALLGAAT